MNAFFAGCFLTWGIVYAVDAVKNRNPRDGLVAVFAFVMAVATGAAHIHGASQ